VSATLDVREVAFRYPDGTEALRRVSLRADAGAAVAVVGPNGAGKTTLVSLLAGFLRPASGEIRVGDARLEEATLGAVRRRTGFLFANPDDQLFMPTVLEDACFGPLAAGAAADDARRRATAQLAELGIAGLGAKFPGHLSAGQKRLATLAGALVMDPDLLVLDEPTAFLDPYARRQLIGKLGALRQTRLLITHDLELVVELCSDVYVLDAGVVVAHGAPAGVLGDDDLMRRHRLERPHILAHRHPHDR
jgi:cobalt/nickel transport system ATP-binding protein